MAKSIPPASKKTKRSACRVSAEERAKPFEDLYTESGRLFCSYCKHIVDYSQIDTIKDHHKSKKHCARKGSRQKKTEGGAFTSVRLYKALHIPLKYTLRKQFFMLTNAGLMKTLHM